MVEREKAALYNFLDFTSATKVVPDTNRPCLAIFN